MRKKDGIALFNTTSTRCAKRLELVDQKLQQLVDNELPIVMGATNTAQAIKENFCSAQNEFRGRQQDCRNVAHNQKTRMAELVAKQESSVSPMIGSMQGCIRQNNERVGGMQNQIAQGVEEVMQQQMIASHVCSRDYGSTNRQQRMS